MKKLVLLAMVGIVATGCNMEEGQKGERREEIKEHAEHAKEKIENGAKAAKPEEVIEDANKKADETAPKI